MAAAAALAAAPAALADTLQYTGPAFGSYYGTYTVHDSIPGPLVNVTAYAGAFQMTDKSGSTLPVGSSFMAWCVDIYDDMNTSSAGTGYTLKSGTTFYSGTNSYMATDLERLASYVFDNSLLTNNIASAAFQLAVWEIADEAGGTSKYNVTSGDFYATIYYNSASPNVLATANTWLGVVTTGTYAIDQQLNVWQQNIAGTTQNLAVFAPVPEPSTSLMLLAGLGLMGFVAKRRRGRLPEDRE